MATTKIKIVLDSIDKAIVEGDKDRLYKIIQCYTCPKQRPTVCKNRCKECWETKITF